jgi:predicted CXXCH cytochrome family protein
MRQEERREGEPNGTQMPAEQALLPAGQASHLFLTHIEVMTVKRFALLVAAGVLWLFVAALPTFADGGPHVMTLNNGTGGLSGDCASCHRAHTAKAANLLTAAVPGLCTNCHNGTKATTDVIDGVQYTPTGVAGTYQQTTVVGALRGGGFNYALMGTASRLSIGGTQTVTLNGAPTGGTFTLTFKGQTTSALAYNATAAQVQAALVALSTVGSSTVYSGSGASNMTGTQTNNITVAKNATTGVLTLTMQNAFRLASQPAVTAGASRLTGGTSPSITVVDTTQSGVREAGYIGVLASGTATTSNHQGTGTVWGNGAVSGTPSYGATGVVLDCTKCHNPHGNGQYRILDTTPGEDWSTTNPAAGYVAGAAAVEVVDVTPVATTITATQARNYTVNPSTNGLTTGVVGTAKQGDYWRYKYDTAGATNFTNFYLGVDPMNTGWNGITKTNKADNAGVSPANTTGLMTAWCIQCHTRYSGLPNATTGVASSLSDNSGGDAVFMYKHGTSRIGCEQCHVSHGSNAAMTSAGSLTVPNPDGTANATGGRLLKVGNRGTCNLCHDPTGTVTPGTVVGPIPATITGLP